MVLRVDTTPIACRRPSKDQRDLRKLLKGNYGILSPEEKRMASTLVAAGQQHLFQHWPAPGESPRQHEGFSRKYLYNERQSWLFRVQMLWHWLVLDSACAGIKDSKKRALLTRLAAEFSGSAQRAEPTRIEVLQAPKILKRPYTVVGANGERREDPYYWLRDDERENPEVLEHLKVKPIPLNPSGMHRSSLGLESGWPQQCRRTSCLGAGPARIGLTMHDVKERCLS